jgi:hypothetical protein
MDLVKNAVTNVGKNAGKKVLQNLGFVEKAVITVYLKTAAQQLRKSADIVSSKGRIENAAVIMANAIATQALQNVAEGTQSAADATAKITSALNTIGAENMPEIPSPATLARGSAKIFTVQFNPAELRVSGSGGGFVRQQNYIEGAASSIDYQAMKTNVTMSCKLIFDESDPIGSFSPLSWPGGAFGVTEMNPVVLGKDFYKAVKAVKNATKVRTEVSAFLAAVRNEYCQRVGFSWGENHYEGDVNNVSAQYTMFNTSGEPVRAIVNFSMLLINPNDPATQNSAAQLLGKPWFEAYKKMFSVTQKSRVSRLSSQQNTLGSILNIPI